MAIAHVCAKCGWDLARVRPQREPHYGLNLVRCPKCQAASVRRKHPIWAAWRRFRRLDFAVTLIGLRAIGICTITLFCTLGSIATIGLVGVFGARQRMPGEAGLFLVVFYVLLPLLLGTFLTAAFAHIARWKMWLGWLAWMAAILFLVSMHGPLDSQFDPRPNPEDIDGPIVGWLFQGVVNVVLPALVAVTVMLLIALPGALIGRVLLRLGEALRRAKWRWRRKRLRLAGAANV